jgi:membrane fusion protein (multidrug efflux system)
VPVRIRLDAKQLTEHPLRVGLSMDAKVDISNTDGRMLADGSRASVINQTKIFDEVNSAADGEVRRIIAANGGPALAKSGPAAGSPGTSNAQASAAHSSIAAPAAAAALVGGGGSGTGSKLAVGGVSAPNSRLLK